MRSAALNAEDPAHLLDHSPPLTTLSLTSQTVVEDAPEVKPSVLVVDSEPDVVGVLSHGLAGAGCDTVVAGCGEEALDRLAERSFDVLLTGVNMPRLRGDELQRIARERDPDLTVLLITSPSDRASAIACLKDGVCDYLLKPFDLADVVVRVGHALERRRLVLENRDYQTNLERRIAEQTEQLKRTVQGSLKTLIVALEAKDPNTRNHSVRVSALATQIAQRLQPENPDFAARVRIAGLFHDIGKIGIPESILQKATDLTPEERDAVRQHTVIGETILSPLLENETVVMVRSHHEQMDGKGYPDGLSGEEIPIGGRIIAVADAYDAMTSPRPYRTQMPLSHVLAVFRQGAGTQWDDDVTTILLGLAREKMLPLHDVDDGTQGVLKSVK